MSNSTFGIRVPHQAAGRQHLDPLAIDVPHARLEFQVGRQGHHAQALAADAEDVPIGLAEVGEHAHPYVQLGGQHRTDLRVPGEVEIGVERLRRHLGGRGRGGLRHGAVPQVEGEAGRHQQRRLRIVQRNGERRRQVDVVDPQLVGLRTVAVEPVIIDRHLAKESLGGGEHGSHLRQGDRPRRNQVRLLGEQAAGAGRGRGVGIPGGRWRLDRAVKRGCRCRAERGGRRRRRCGGRRPQTSAWRGGRAVGGSARRQAAGTRRRGIGCGGWRRGIRRSGWRRGVRRSGGRGGVRRGGGRGRRRRRGNVDRAASGARRRSERARTGHRSRVGRSCCRDARIGRGELDPLLARRGKCRAQREQCQADSPGQARKQAAGFHDRVPVRKMASATAQRRPDRPRRGNGITAKPRRVKSDWKKPAMIDLETIVQQTFVASVEGHATLGSTNDRALECAGRAAADCRCWCWPNGRRQGGAGGRTCGGPGPAAWLSACW